MNGRERLTAAMRGDKVDRVPIWLREGFEAYERPTDPKDFRQGWKHDSVYRDLRDYVEPHIDYFVPWKIGALNRSLMIPPKSIVTREDSLTESGSLVSEGYIQCPGCRLPFRIEWKRNNTNGWKILYPVNSVDDLRAVAEIPFELDTAAVEKSVESYAEALEAAGDRGRAIAWLSSPIVIISGLMSFQLFLELSITERGYFHLLLEEISRRQLEVLKHLLSLGSFETVITIGGAEQCTPPLMAPEMYDEYVVPYESPFVDLCHDHGIPVNVHCHGKIRHALGCMREMGVDATDPVEPPPAGDLDFREAREISRGMITLQGNVEFNEFVHLTPVEMRRRVREVLADGNRRMILSTSAGPTTAVTRQVADNYRAFVDAALEYGC